MDAARLLLLLLLSSHFGCRYTTLLCPIPCAKLLAGTECHLSCTTTKQPVKFQCTAQQATQQKEEGSTGVYVNKRRTNGRTEGKKITRHTATHDRKAHGRAFYLSSFLRRRMTKQLSSAGQGGRGSERRRWTNNNNNNNVGGPEFGSAVWTINS